MNVLSNEKKTLVLSLITEGQSIRATSRITNVSQPTILKLLLDAAAKARDIHDAMMMNIQSKFIETDEIWNFIQKKQKRVKSEEEERECGDFYTFICLDADTKLVPVYRVGKRTASVTVSVMKELSLRVPTRFQLSTDAFRPYSDAVSRVWGADIDYAQIHKEYAELNEGQKRYSPARIIRVTKNPIMGNPNNDRISTSYVERQNLTVRMQMRRFTRLTNGFSKSVKHHEAAVDLHFFFYNFMRIHSTLRVTPAMEAAVTNRLWSWEDLLTWGAEAKAA
ncbi:MAG: IS1 family transposase [Bacteroidota bacterium]